MARRSFSWAKLPNAYKLQRFYQRAVVAGGVTAYALTCTTSALALSGNTATLGVGRNLTAQPTALTLSGKSATLGVGRVLTAQKTALTLSGTNATLVVGRVLTAQKTALVLTGNNATLVRGYPLTATVTALTLVGNTATLTYASSATDYPLTAQPTALALTGNTATLGVGRGLTAQATALALTGNSATFVRGYTLTAQAGSLALTGYEAVFEWEIAPHAGGDAPVRRKKKVDDPDVNTQHAELWAAASVINPILPPPDPRLVYGGTFDPLKAQIAPLQPTVLPDTAQRLSPHLAALFAFALDEMDE